MAYSPPYYSRSRVDRAGRAMAEGTADFEDRLIINDWRTSHALPLNVVYMALKRLGSAADKTAIFSQRIKRLPSIEIKFSRNPRMKLTRMQDLGGCRVVLQKASLISELRKRYKESRIITHELVRDYDYLAVPKPDGYRGAHLIFKYTGTRPSAYDGQFIELQIRTRLQHGWAMAVETVDHLLSQGLKVGGGDNEWKRFFALMGTCHALSENTIPVPGTPTDKPTLSREVRELANSLRVKARLKGVQAAQRAIDHEDLRGMDYFLLALSARDKYTMIRGYRQREIESARNEYVELEAQDGVDVVLVRVQDAQSLRQAYPSYFMDTSQFLNSLDELLLLA